MERGRIRLEEKEDPWWTRWVGDYGGREGTLEWMRGRIRVKERED